MQVKFYICPVCGNIVAKVKDSGIPVVCCGKPMQELIANTTDATQEKHVPQYVVQNNKVVVTVGSTLHPMQENHYIEWIFIKTSLGNQRKHLLPNASPVATFALLPDEKVLEVYAYCNLHGLWKA